MRVLIRIIILLFLFIFTYNYFFGDDEEKKSAGKVIANAKELISSIGTVIKSEKEKYYDGKYDDAIYRLSGLFNGIRSRTGFSGQTLNHELEKLESEKREIEEEYQVLENEPDSVRERKKEQLNLRLEEIVSKAERILEKIEKQ